MEMGQIRKKITVWWWRMKPRPCPLDKGYTFEKLVEWCAKGKQNVTIYHIGWRDK